MKFEENKDAFKELYNRGTTWRVICTVLGITMGTVSRWHKKLKLPYRDASKVRHVNRKRR